MIKTLFAVVLAMFVPFAAMAQETPPAMSSAYDFTFTGGDGQPVALSDYRGKVLLVVNTATQCGLAGQFRDLQLIKDEYGDQGLVVIGVPSNDFGGQEPLEAADVASKTKEDYGVDYLFTAKTTVSGEAAHPFYKWAALQNKGGLLSDKPRWNFHKYLVGRDGQLFGSYASTTSPQDEKLVKDLETALAFKAK